MSNTYYATWAGRSNLTPAFSAWLLANGSSAGTPPTVSLVGNSDTYQFTPANIPSDIIAKLDSGDTSMIDPSDRYRYFVIRQSDGSMTFVQTPTGFYSLTAKAQTPEGQGIGSATLLVYAGLNLLPTYTITLGLDGTTAEPFRVNAGEYTFVCIMQGYTFASQTINITDDQQVVIIGTGVIIAPPSAGKQNITFGINAAGGSGTADGITVTAIPTPWQEINGDTIDSTPQTTISASGTAVLMLTKGYQYFVTEKRNSGLIISKTITITTDDTKSFGSYVDDNI